MKEVTFHLEAFNGPLDLLLSLLSKNKIDIKDIPIADILEQYLDYIRQMQEFDLEVASEFITMAAQLLYIKSKMLLPVYEEERAAEDPRAGLVEALLEYQRIKEAGNVLSLRAQIGRDLFVKGQEPLEPEACQWEFHYTSDVLTQAMADLMIRVQRTMPPPVTAFQGIVGYDPVPVDEKIGVIICMFVRQERIPFESLVFSAQSRSEIVAIFLAVLELFRTRKIMMEESAQDGCVLRLATKEEQTLYEASTEDNGEHDRIA